MSNTATVAHLLRASCVSHIVVASHPVTTPDMHNAYVKDLSEFMYHGSYDKITKFTKPVFLSGPSLAASYAHDGYLYKCKVHSKHPYVLVESRDRMRRTRNNSPEGMLISGTDETLRDFIKNELLAGASSKTIADFDTLYAQRGPDVPARLFCSEDYGSGWDIVAKNLVRLGYDSLLFMDESFDTCFRGSACFVPDASLIELVDSCDIGEYGEIPDSFLE